MSVFLLTATHSQGDTTSLTVKQVYTDVKEGFSKLVSTLQGPARHTYEVYVKQYKIDGWSSLVLEGLSLIAFIILVFTAFSKATWENETPNFWGVISILGSIGLLAIFLVFFHDFTPNIKRISNPEYYAIQDIISAFK